MPKAQEKLREITPLLIGVQSNPERDVSLETLAAEHGYSPSHFHRVFTEATGETPKAHVERIRLERAAYRLSLTKESVLDIALSVGFQNHETFSRAFKRRYNSTPTAWRSDSRLHQKRWAEANRFKKKDCCELSAVSFLTLKPMTLLGMRRLGQYGTFGPPYFDGPSEWSPLFALAKRRNLPIRRLCMVICYDNPGLTPPHLQALDACVPLLKPAGAPRKGDIRRVDFPGGFFGVIEHRGPVKTLEHAYRTLAFGINQSGRFMMRDGPPLEILREVAIGGDPNLNLNEIYLPVEPIK